MKRTQKRRELIRVGREIIVRQGFNAAGLSDILAAADVPKGSFYYYFKNKEDFGLAIIEDFASEYQEKLDRTLGNEQLPPKQRLLDYFAAGILEMETCSCIDGCLNGNLAQEMAPQSEVFRDRLNQILVHWESQLANCLQAMQGTGALPKETDTTNLAQFILGGWQGAVLKAKVVRSVAPMRAFVDTLFCHIFEELADKST